MANLFACRLASYRPYEARAWTHLPEVGIRHLEMMAPPPAERDALRKQLSDHGLAVSSLQLNWELDQPDAMAAARPLVESCAELGAPICLLVVRPGNAAAKVIYQRLAELGDIAGELNVTLCLETHPELATNGEVAAATMEAVDHPSSASTSTPRTSTSTTTTATRSTSWPGPSTTWPRCT